MPNATIMGRLLATTIVSLGAAYPGNKAAWLFIAAPAMALPSAEALALFKSIPTIASSNSYTIQGECDSGGPLR